jgi:hypothetical protein
LPVCRFSWVNVTVRLQAIEKPVTSKLLVEHSEKRIHAAAKHVGMVRVWFFLLLFGLVGAILMQKRPHHPPVNAARRETQTVH